MTKVAVTKSKLDTLAEKIGIKSKRRLPLTIDEMGEAVDSIEVGGTPNLQSKTYTVDSAGTETITADSGYDGLSNVQVSVPTGSIDVSTSGNFRTINGTTYFRFNADAGIDSNNDMGTEGYISDHTLVSGYEDYSVVPSGTSVTPTESAQTIGGIWNMMAGAVTVNAIPSNYVGSGITQRSSSDLTASGATVTAPAGYYASDASKTIDNVQPYVGITGATFYTENNVRKFRFYPFAEVDTFEGDTPGYFPDGTNFSGDTIIYSAVPSNTTITPSTSAQTIGGSKWMMEGAVTVAAMPSGSVSASATKGSVSNHAISVTPTATVGTAGYLAAGSTNGTAVSVSASELVSGTYTVDSSGTKDVTNYASASIAAGSATASATKGSVSNHAISVTPSVTRTAGWVTAGSANGTAVTVSASELVSGNLEITENGTGINVANYETVSVAVPTGGVTQDANGFIVLPETGGGGGGSTGLVYESGTWTPSEDIAKGEILFANTHSTLPILVCLVDATGTYNDTLYTNIQFMYCNYYSIGGNPLYFSSTSLRYGFVQYIYRGSNATSCTNSYTDLVTSPSDSGSTMSNQTRYHVDEAGFYPNTISTTRYWRAGRTYKWVAVWAPES